MAKKKTEEAVGSNGYQIGDMVTIRYRVVGVTPLMQHNAASMRPGTSVGVPGGIQKPTTEHLSGDAEAEAGTYKTSDGRFYHPAEAFRAAVIEAVIGTKVGKRAAKDVIGAGLFVTHTEAVLIGQDGKPLTEYGVDTRNVVNPTTGGMIPRSRPIWKEWAMEVEFEYDPLNLSEPIITQALNIAGSRVGIGQLRPKPPKRGRNKPGNGNRYGKFKAQVIQ